MSTPSIVAREYNPTNGAFIDNLTTLSFGNVAVGTHSSVKVIDLAFINVATVSNVRFGLLSAGTLTVTDVPSEIINSDGSVSNGYFGVAHSNNFDPILAGASLTTHFRDIYNPDGTPDNAVAIGLRDIAGQISQYIYLDLQLENSNIGANGGSYRVFFDCV